MSKKTCLLLLGLRMLALPEPARSQDTNTAHTETVQVLVQGALFEGTWNRIDYAAQWHTHRRRAAAAGVPIVDMIRSYDSGFNVELSPQSRWKMNVTQECEEPVGWPIKLEGQWSSYVRRCRRLYADAEAFLQGKLPDPTRGRAWHFGGAMDSPKPGMVLLHVPGAANRFYGRTLEASKAAGR